MSESAKEDMAILNAARREYEAAQIYDAIKAEEYRRLVKKATKEIKIEGVKEEDKDLYL